MAEGLRTSEAYLRGADVPADQMDSHSQAAG